MEEALVLILGGIVRILIWVVVEFCFYIVCWSIGWCVLKFITIGRYPKPNSKPEYAIAVGVLTIISLIVFANLIGIAG